MNTARHPVQVLLAGLSTALLFLVGSATAALAGPVPIEPEPMSNGSPGLPVETSDGIAVWQAVSIGLLAALAAVVLTLAVTHVVASHQRSPRRPAHA